MSLRYDLMIARDLCVELEQLCQSAGIEFASVLLEAGGKELWQKTLGEDRAALLAFLCATPSQRKRKAAWKGDRMQALLAVGSLIHARQAVRYLEIAVAVEDSTRSTARESVAEIADAAFLREGIQIQLWPFDTHAPFAE